MRGLLGEEYPAFAQCYLTETPRPKGLRVNRLKADVEEFRKKAPFALKPIPWAEDGFFCPEEEKPGKHPWHEAGVYYLQEPSAMVPASLLQAQPGERILDLCAAPGGKTTQIASAMAGEGILISNEIHPERAGILSQNVERLGIRNCIVTNTDSETLAGRFPGYFDRILVDAPCSGEGMFRKEGSQAATLGSGIGVQNCAGFNRCSRTKRSAIGAEMLPKYMARSVLWVSSGRKAWSGPRSKRAPRSSRQR